MLTNNFKKIMFESLVNSYGTKTVINLSDYDIVIGSTAVATELYLQSRESVLDILKEELTFLGICH